MYELVRVGADSLIGEIIRLEGDTATIQASHRLQQLQQANAGLSCAPPGLCTPSAPSTPQQQLIHSAWPHSFRGIAPGNSMSVIAACQWVLLIGYDLVMQLQAACTCQGSCWGSSYSTPCACCPWQWDGSWLSDVQYCVLFVSQVYEETAGLTVGDVVTRTKKVGAMQQ